MHHRAQVELLELLGRESHRGRDLGERRHGSNFIVRSFGIAAHDFVIHPS